MKTVPRLSVIAAWVAFVLAVVLRLALGAGNFLVLMTGVIALSVTGIAVTRK